MSIADRRRAGRLALVVGVFFASGFAALLYQVIWQRLLALFSGADVFSVTIIVAAFMGGLGCGNLSGGHVADRVSRATCLLIFAGAELAIAGFALGSRLLYYDVLYTFAGAWSLPVPAVAALLFASLLLPTFLMGLSLPLLARGLTDDISDAARVVGSLYGWNTLGAAVGAFSTPWILLRRFDFDTCLWIGAALNVACSFAVLVIRRRVVAEATLSVGDGEYATASSSGPPGAPVFGFASWLAIYALSGAIALSLEIAWFRVLGVINKSTSFTFGTLLGVYLIGIAIGSIAGARAASRSNANPVTRFLAIQTGITVYAVTSLALLIWYVDGDASRPASLVRFFRNLDPFPVSMGLADLARAPLGWIAADDVADRRARMFLLLYAGVPLLLVLPASFGMGLAFPWLQRALQTDARWIGRRVGWLQTANIAGSLLGSLVTGFALLPLLGSSGTFRALAIAATIFPLLALRASRSRLAPLIGLGLLLAAAAALPSEQLFWARLHGIDSDQILVEEDASGVSAIAPKFGDGGEHSVAVGGAEISTFPFGGYNGTHTLLGAIPVLLHPAPKRVAVVGLGSGDTLYAAASRPGIEEVIGIEIVGSQLDLLREFQLRGGDPGLAALFEQANVRIEIADGRTFLRHDPRLYDVIEADALRPTAAYAGNLYSREYFAQIGESLGPGGLAVTWAPTPRVTDTLRSIYPYVLQLGQIAIASNAPIAFDRAALERTAANPAVRAHFSKAGVDIVALLATHLDKHPVRRFGPGEPPPSSSDLNSDLFPRDEFLVPSAAR